MLHEVLITALEKHMFRFLALIKGISTDKNDRNWFVLLRDFKH